MTLCVCVGLISVGLRVVCMTLSNVVMVDLCVSGVLLILMTAGILVVLSLCSSTRRLFGAWARIVRASYSRFRIMRRLCICVVTRVVTLVGLLHIFIDY